MIAANINGLVLSGGKSSRMGVDKATLHYHGSAQVDYVANQLKLVCQEVFISVQQQSKSVNGFPQLRDTFNCNGPINGILSALDFNPAVAWLVVAVDMPNVNERVFANLIRQRDPAKLATCYFNVLEKFPEPLLTIWEPHASNPLKKFLADGKMSPKEFLKTNDVKLAETADHSVLLNINSPQELERYKQTFSKD